MTDQSAQTNSSAVGNAGAKTRMPRNQLIALIIIGGYLFVLFCILLAAAFGTSCEEAVLNFKERILNLKLAAANPGSIDIAALMKASDDMTCSAAPWSELARAGFLLLGGGVTTIIGYYFGSQGAEIAQERAADAVAKAERAKAVADESNRDLQKVLRNLQDRQEESGTQSEVISEDAEGIVAPGSA